MREPKYVGFVGLTVPGPQTLQDARGEPCGDEERILGYLRTGSTIGASLGRAADLLRPEKRAACQRGLVTDGDWV